MSTLKTITDPFIPANGSDPLDAPPSMGRALWPARAGRRRRPQPRGTDTVAVLYENREWMEPLFAAMDRRGVRYEGIDLADSAYLLGEHDDSPLVINRVSPSAHLRGHGSAIPLVRGWLEMLERAGKRVINGATSFRLETSKVAQYQLIRDLGLPLPATAVFNDRTAVRTLLDGFPFPAILKPPSSGRWRISNSNWQSLGTMLSAVPPSIVPTCRVVCGTSNSPSNGPFSAHRRARPVMKAISSAAYWTALTPVGASEEWHSSPRTATRTLFLPLCATTTFISVGSPRCTWRA